MSTEISTSIDLSNCDREPIHIPGTIQPHGVLLVLREPGLEIIQISDNTVDWLGCPPAQLLGTSLKDYIGNPQIEAMLRQLSSADSRVHFGIPLMLPMEIEGQTRILDAVVHRHDNLLLLELEEPSASDPAIGISAFHGILDKLQTTRSIQALCDSLVVEIQQLTGFDRVMVYRFAEDQHGEVIAEALSAGLPAFLGLHYPASDIPQQARRLYAQNWLRLIADVNYQPVPLLPPVNPLNERPLDLSYATLRSVSPIHIQYLKNMGVAASLSISLMDGERLWGLIACHHYQPKYLSFALRTVCELLGSVVSLQIAAKTIAERALQRNHHQILLVDLLQAVSEDDDIADISHHKGQLLALVDAQGAAVWVDGRCHPVGRIPPEDSIKALIDWLRHRSATDIFVSDRLAGLWPAAAAAALQDTCSGLLAVPINRERGDYLLFFRPEQIYTVNWAGNPNKPVESSDETVLTPRHSFASWQETVRQRSLPWHENQIDMARELRNALVHYLIRHAEALTELNYALQQSNKELDAFAYIASHDLKEPLRGIYGYAEELDERYHDLLDDAGREQLQALKRLADRMDNLLDSLLHYSRVNRLELDYQQHDLNTILDEALDMIGACRVDAGGRVRVPGPLPQIPCDRVRMREVFTNLISNALKYSDKQDGWVEVGYIDAPPQDKSVTLYVRDNGIGINERHFQRIFQMFKRLHGVGQYGGGSGAGLTIVKKIIERHGGRIWLESERSKGSTFYFSLRTDHPEADQTADTG